MQRTTGKTAALAAAIAFCIGLPGPTTAQNLKMRIADVYPVGHTVPNTTIKIFIEDMKKRVGDKITFEHYPAEQLGKGKDLLSLTQTGVVDIGLVVPSYVSDKMPLSAVAELPGYYATSCQGTLAAHKLATEGILAAQEFSTNGVRVLITHAFAPFQAVSTKPFDGLKSYAGQKLRTLGAATDLTIKKLDAVPIRISAPEINEAMSRGTIDGGLLGIATVISYDLGRYLKSVTRGESFGGAVVTYSISAANWGKLTPELQKAMTEAGLVATRNGCEAADKAVDGQYERLKAAGVAIVELSGADKEALRARTSDIGKEWADALDKRGKQGGQTLSAFLAALKSN